MNIAKITIKVEGCIKVEEARLKKKKTSQDKWRQEKRQDGRSTKNTNQKALGGTVKF